MANTTLIQPNAFVGFDDADKALAKSGVPARASVILRLANALNSVANGGRMIRTFWRGYPASGDIRGYVAVWNHKHNPGRSINVRLLYYPDTTTPTAGQGVSLSISTSTAVTATSTWVFPYDFRSTTPKEPPRGYFQFSQNYGYTTTGIYELDLGNPTTNGPLVGGGMLFESAELNVDPSNSRISIPVTNYAAGLDVIGSSVVTSYAQLDTLRSQFLHTWNRCRPSIGWNAPGSYIEFNTSTQSYRYIFDQTIGDGGTAASTTGPGVTFPLRYTGRGLQTSVSVAVFVYAAMTGTTNTGTIAITHKASGGASMENIAALTGITVNSTTPRWYPDLTTATLSTFNARTDLQPERILLCGKSSGATNNLRVYAWTMFPVPSSTIT